MTSTVSSPAAPPRPGITEEPGGADHPPAAPAAPIGHRGLTTRGRCLLAGGLAASVCSIFLSERDLLRVGLLAILLPVVAWVVAASRRTRLVATHHVTPRRLSPGAEGSVDLLVTNSGNTRTRPIELLEPAVGDLSTGTHCMIPALARGRSAVSRYPLRPLRRGRFVLGPPQLRLGDPFGCWEDNRTLPVRTEVLVVPRVVALQGSPVSGGMRSAPSGRAAQGSVGGDPDVGVRAYQRGDDIRTVHWRASARHDDLMVRLTEPVSHGGATIVLDHRARAHAGRGPDASLEVAVSLAASTALHLLSGDQHVRLVSHTGRELAGGHDIADDVLAGLAVLDADPNPNVSIAAVTAPGLLIGIFGALDDTATSLIVAARRRRANSIAILLAAEDWGGSDSMSGARRLLLAAGWRVVVLRRGDDLAEVWRQACATGDGWGTAAVRRTAR